MISMDLFSFPFMYYLSHHRPMLFRRIWRLFVAWIGLVSAERVTISSAQVARRVLEVDRTSVSFCADKRKEGFHDLGSSGEFPEYWEVSCSQDCIEDVCEK